MLQIFGAYGASKMHSICELVFLGERDDLFSCLFRTMQVANNGEAPVECFNHCQCLQQDIKTLARDERAN
jgi:hypothetical protein